MRAQDMCFQLSITADIKMCWSKFNTGWKQHAASSAPDNVRETLHTQQLFERLLGRWQLFGTGHQRGALMGVQGQSLIELVSSSGTPSAKHARKVMRGYSGRSEDMWEGGRHHAEYHALRVRLRTLTRIYEAPQLCPCSLSDLDGTRIYQTSNGETVPQRWSIPSS